MKWIITNWYIIAAVLAAVTVSFLGIIKFWRLPSEKQKEKIREWLIWACIEAERALQSGTGQLKLREVWNKFCAVPAFSWVTKVITFDLFTQYVNEALLIMKKLLTENNELAKYVYGENSEAELIKMKQQLTEQSKLQ